MAVTRNGMMLASLKRGTSQIAFVFQGTVQIWAHEIVFVLGASSAGTYLVDIVNARPGLWASSTPKRIVAPAGVERGSGTTWVFAPAPAGSPIASSWGGKLTLDVYGTLSGIGGAPNSGVGGNVIVGTVTGKDGQKLIVNVFAGAILRAGGGGGGRAGNGGQGYYQSPYTYQEGPLYQNSYYMYRHYHTGNYGDTWWWGSLIASTQGNGIAGSVDYTARYYGDGFYYQTNGVQSAVGSAGNSSDGYVYWTDYQIYRWQTRYNTIYTAGGIASNAGRGQGFDGPATSGGVAVAGGTNAGASGKSGDGGAYGNAGTTGANGSMGNYTGGLAGAAGGLAGFYLAGAANVNFTNNGGTLLGRLAA